MKLKQKSKHLFVKVDWCSTTVGEGQKLNLKFYKRAIRFWYSTHYRELSALRRPLSTGIVSATLVIQKNYAAGHTALEMREKLRRQPGF